MIIGIIMQFCPLDATCILCYARLYMYMYYYVQCKFDISLKETL